MSDLFFWLMFASPLAGFLINGLRFNSPNRRISSWVGCLFSSLAFAGALGGVFIHKQKTATFTRFDWLDWESLSVSFSFYVDPLAWLMLLLITGVGTVIHIYSVGYMSKDPGISRYFAYLNLFVFFMLILVLADSLPLLFVGWEGVGLCSYLLIGFWFKDSLKVAAGRKAFLVNRIGDGCFLLGLFFIFSYFKTFHFQSINILAGEESFHLLHPGALGALFLFLGATAKSAQMPLHIWLADAMAGPTPVSALIHAATMVTAGVYLVLRLASLYAAAADVLWIMGWVGALTAFGAALAAAGQRDLKKTLAYSTVSQLGYMFMALSVKAFSAGAFHLLTHGFFKALLFLCAGSLIHGLNGQQDIYQMGGLKKYFPKTFWTWMIGALALVALPPFSGFFSKDEVLWSLFSSGNPGLWLIALLTSAVTAFYMTRLTSLVFFGNERRPKSATTPHESPPIMSYPLMLLAFCSAVAGFLGIPHLFSKALPGHPPHLLHQWLAFLPGSDFSGSLLLEAGLMLLSVLLGLSVIGFSAWYFLKEAKRPSFVILEKAFYVDRLLKRFLVKPIENVSVMLAKDIEGTFLQGGIVFFIKQLLILRKVFSAFQSVSLQSFLVYFVLGLSLLLIGVFIS